MSRIALTIGLFYGFFLASAQPARVTHSVVLLGNVADIEDAAKYCVALAAILDTVGHNQTLILNGDLVQSDRDEMSRYENLDMLLRTCAREQGRKIVLLPGDRDWDQSGQNGWNDVLELEEHVRKLNLPNVYWPLTNGCPGPTRIELDLTLNLIAVNTQWWNHPFDKPIPSSAVCDYADAESAIEEMRSQIEDAGYGNLIIAGHYPIRSNGEYGGRFPWHKWLFPVPIISSGRTAYRQNVGTPVDLANERYEEYRVEMEDLFLEYTSMVYASGHERNREVLRYANNVFVNSGAPSRGRHVSTMRETRFASSEAGLTSLQYDVDGNVWTEQIDYRNGRFEKTSRQPILQAPCLHPDPSIPVNERLVPCLQEAYVLTAMLGDHPDSITRAANPDYQRSGFVRFLFGDHYRASWTNPVTIPTLDLDSTFGGLVPYSLGGGRQTNSLWFEAESGYAYAFRSIDKDPSRELSLDLRNSFLSLAIQDQTTTEYPYGAVITSNLLDNTDILHPRPEVFIMPDDPKLGPFQERFGGMLGMLEDLPTRKRSVKPFAEADDIRRSNSMLRELYKGLNNTVDDREYVRSRVFDLLVGDWKRHEENWMWAGFANENGMHYRPVPHDRDDVFSRWDGVLPWLSDREWAKPAGENFGHDIKDLRSLNWNARHLDRLLMNELSREEWIEAATHIQQNLPDSAIEHSTRSLPEGARDVDVPEILDKLKYRRDNLVETATQYYSLLSKQVDVVGSINDELFVVRREVSGEVSVKVFDIENGTGSNPEYERIFHPDQTKEIRLFGLAGNDRFDISGSARRSILIRIIPGQGADVVSDSSNVKKGKRKTRVYSKGAQNSVSGDSELKMAKVPYDDAYTYQRNAFEFNTYRPSGYIFFSTGDGLQFGGGTRFTRHAYDKPDFSAIHTVRALVSTLGNYYFQYDGRLRHVIGRWDLTLGALASRRSQFNYFFGLGNESELDRDRLNSGYYSLQYSNLYAEVGLRRDFWKRSFFEIAVRGESFSGESNPDNIMDDIGDAIPGNHPLRMARALWRFELDLRDRPDLPRQGMRLRTQGYFSQILNTSGRYASNRAFLEWYGTARPVTLSGRLGGWFHANLPPYYDLEYLGQRSNLRGYRRNRFAGDQGGIFFNADARIQLIDNTTSLIPHKIGLLLFYDTGRVFQSEEDSEIWHHGYGFGVYAVPVRERYVVGLSLAFSREEKALILVGFGKLF